MRELVVVHADTRTPILDIDPLTVADSFVGDVDPHIPGLVPFTAVARELHYARGVDIVWGSDPTIPARMVCRCCDRLYSIIDLAPTEDDRWECGNCDGSEQPGCGGCAPMTL